jgi:Flp pilus assembly pilin Flp
MEEKELSRLRQPTEMRCLIQEVRVPARGEKGIAAVEFALILPVLLVMVFAIIDVGRLIQARLIIANVSREGGNIASRDAMTNDNGLITMLQASGRPLDLSGSGIIYISRIHAGTKAGPYILQPWRSQTGAGSLLGAPSSIIDVPPFGLSPPLYAHLEFDDDPIKQTSDISEITVVEVYSRYTPITPLPNFIADILSSNIGSKAVF